MPGEETDSPPWQEQISISGPAETVAAATPVSAQRVRTEVSSAEGAFRRAQELLCSSKDVRCAFCQAVLVSIGRRGFQRAMPR